MRSILAIICCSLAVSVVSGTEPIAPQPLLPKSFQWQSPPNLPGVQGAWVLGADKTPGSYVFRVRLMRGARIPPHTHPDTRHTTVLTGTLYVGFGETFAANKLVAVPAGAVYVAPAGVAHFLLARDGEVVYQESGVGPTATVPISAAGASASK